MPNITSILVNVIKKAEQADELERGQVKEGPLVYFRFEFYPTGNTDPRAFLWARGHDDQVGFALERVVRTGMWPHVWGRSTSSVTRVSTAMWGEKEERKETGRKPTAWEPPLSGYPWTCLPLPPVGPFPKPSPALSAFMLTASTGSGSHEPWRVVEGTQAWNGKEVTCSRSLCWLPSHSLCLTFCHPVLTSHRSTLPLWVVWKFRVLRRNSHWSIGTETPVGWWLRDLRSVGAAFYYFPPEQVFRV